MSKKSDKVRKQLIINNAVEQLIDGIEGNIGAIEVAVYNLGAQIGNVSLEDTSLKQFELGWRLGSEGLFRLAKAVTPGMIERGSGTLRSRSGA